MTRGHTFTTHEDICLSRHRGNITSTPHPSSAWQRSHEGRGKMRTKNAIRPVQIMRGEMVLSRYHAEAKIQRRDAHCIFGSQSTAFSQQTAKTKQTGDMKRYVHILHVSPRLSPHSPHFLLIILPPPPPSAGAPCGLRTIASNAWVTNYFPMRTPSAFI